MSRRGAATLARVMVAAALTFTGAACGDGSKPAASPDVPTTETSTTETSTTETFTETSAAERPPCGVTIAEVQRLLPPTSGVTENSTPDPGRCNFTWNEGGPRGIDIAIVPGGRSSFEVPAGYQPLEGYGDEAFTSFARDRASAFAFVGDDLYAADVVADGGSASEAELRDLCLQLLELALD